MAMANKFFLIGSLFRKYRANYSVSIGPFISSESINPIRNLYSNLRICSDVAADFHDPHPANARACKLNSERQPYVTKTDNCDFHFSIVHLRELMRLLCDRWFRREEHQPGI